MWKYDILPLEVYSGDIEDHSLEPEDHEEALRKGAVSNALAIATSLRAESRSTLVRINNDVFFKMLFILQ